MKSSKQQTPSPTAAASNSHSEAPPIAQKEKFGSWHRDDDFDKSKRLPIQPFYEDYDIPKSEAWIVWLSDDEFKVVDLRVYRIVRDKEHKFSRDWMQFITQQNLLIKDIGNCCSGWMQTPLSEVLIRLGFARGLWSRRVARQCLRELSKIREFKDEISRCDRFFEEFINDE